MRSIIFLIFLSLLSFVTPSFSEVPYYAFYPSSKGPNFKLFQHNIYNFEVDMPSNWTFGVAGKPPGQIIMMYPEGLNTGVFSSGYETISVGILPYASITLEEANEAVSLGMRQGHKDIEFANDKSTGSLNGNAYLRFSYIWLSKTGNKVKENVLLVKYKERIYSVTIRSIGTMNKKQQNIHKGIINTFKPIEPVKLQ